MPSENSLRDNARPRGLVFGLNGYLPRLVQRLRGLLLPVLSAPALVHGGAILPESPLDGLRDGLPAGAAVGPAIGVGLYLPLLVLMVAHLRNQPRRLGAGKANVGLSPSLPPVGTEVIRSGEVRSL